MVFDDYMDELEGLEFSFKLPKIKIKLPSIIQKLPTVKLAKGVASLVKKGIKEAKKIKITITPRDWKRAGKIALIGAGIAGSIFLGPQVLPLALKGAGALLTAGKTILPKIITKAPTILKNIPITGTTGTVKHPSPPAPIRPRPTSVHSARTTAPAPTTPLRNKPASSNDWFLPALIIGGFLLMQGGKR